tara:strand:- start:51228 stop:52676 length:1449 start_codon:yes stop_codon:yes gene_type:complete
MADINIYQETQIVQKMKRRNRPVRALLNGTASIREGIENKNGDAEPSVVEYIQKEEKESKTMYANRMMRTYVTPYLKTAISDATGQIFKNPISIKTTDNAELDSRIESILKNVDMQGTDLNEWIMKSTDESLGYGMVLAYGGFSNPTSSENLSEQISSGARPFIKMVSYFDLLGFNFDSQGRITMLRFQEEADIQDDFLGSDRVTQVRVVYPTKYEVYRMDENNNGILFDSGKIARFDENKKQITTHVPVEVMYGRKLATLNAASVFEDMAFMNLEHTQVNSDLNWSSHFYLTPFLITTMGENSGNLEGDINPTLASYVNLNLPYGADAKWVETNGSAHKSGMEQIQSIERRMSVSQMSSSVSVSGAKETATGRALDADSTNAKLKLHAEAVETFAKQIIQMLASFMPDVRLPDFTVIANKDFNIALNGQTISDMSNMVIAKQLSLETMLSELKRRGILADDIEIVQEMQRIQDEMALEGVS